MRRRFPLKIPPILLEGDQPAPPPVSGPGARYALGPAAPAQHFAGPELPEAYGTKRLWLVPRDPRWLYACWDFTREQQRAYNRRSAAGHLVLRIHPDSLEREAVADIHVHPESRHWFVPVGRGGGPYVAELSYPTRGGDWVRITASGPAVTPPEDVAPEAPAQFVTIRVDVPFAPPVRPTQVVAEEKGPLPGPVVPARPPALVPSLASGPPSGAEPTARSGRPTARREPPAAALPPAETCPAPPPVTIPVAAVPPEWTPAQDRALAEAVNMEKVRLVWAGPPESAAAALAQRGLPKELASLAAAQMIVPTGESKALLEGGGISAPAGVEYPGAGVIGPAAVSSPFGGVEGQRGGFWFNVNAELIVYGATEPDAEVTIGGRPIHLRPDGSFSFRFAFPDGSYQLPVRATASESAHVRQANLYFFRHTLVSGEVGAHAQAAELKTPAAENVS